MFECYSKIAPIANGIECEKVAAPIVDQCEESAVDIQVARFMNHDEKFNEELYRKYGISSAIGEPYKRVRYFVRNGMSEHIEQVASAIATFKETDKILYHAMIFNVERYKDEFESGIKEKILGLADNYHKAGDSFENFEGSVSSSLKIMGYGPTSKESQKKQTFKKYVSLEAIVLN